MADELLRRAVVALKRLEAISEVAARSYDPNFTSHTAEEDRIPIRFTPNGDLAPAENSLFLLHRSRINQAINPRDEFRLELAVLGAEEALEEARRQIHAPHKRTEPREFRARVVELHEKGLSVAEITFKLRIQPRFVVRVLAAAGHLPGRLWSAPTLDDDGNEKRC